MLRKNVLRRGFALPSVLVVSVVMLIVLLAALTQQSSIAASVTHQYYTKLAKLAAESGAMKARTCLRETGYTAQWSTSTPLRPNSDCYGAQTPSTCPLTTRDARCGVIDSSKIRTSFTVSGLTAGDGPNMIMVITGATSVLNSSGLELQRYTFTLRQALARKVDPSTSRPTHRYWAFGIGAGLDFGISGNNVSPVKMCDPGPCDIGEGSTVVTSRAGALRFWTDGQYVYTPGGTLMNNSGGSSGGALLTANASTTQAAAVFPIDSTESKYVIITNDSVNENSPTVGRLYYSIVDMTLDGGKGSIPEATKNVPLWTGNNSYASEAMTAAPKADGTGFWVFTYDPQTTNIYRFGFTGSNRDATTPVTFPSTTAGNSVVSGNPNYIGFGTLNFNSDYTKLVVLAGLRCASSPCTKVSGVVRVMDFNTFNGAITNRYMFNNYDVDNSQGYSADFSPDSSYIYTTGLYPARLARYKLSGATDSASIKSTEEFIGASGGTESGADPFYDGGGQVLLAPNNKMYVANQKRGNISVIANPDAATLPADTLAQRQAKIGWTYGGQALTGTNLSWYGLPQLVTSFSPKYIIY